MSGGRMGARAAFAAAVAVLVAMVFGAVSASAETVEFKPSAEQSFEVPAGVTQVEVLAVGGAGEFGLGEITCDNPTSAGGSGAKVTATLPVGAGETLKVRFGGGGARGASGYCEAGNGGGRSEVLTASPLVVAGGGGGGGSGSFGVSGRTGGSAEALVGNNGESAPSFGGEGGEGGGLSEGKGGAGFSGCVASSAGMLENGGEGGGWNGSTTAFCEGAGGGGGGHTGGGGGGGGFNGGGGGGAGSSFIAPSATGEVSSGANEAQRVLITYTVTETVQERLENLLADVTGVGPGMSLANKVKAIQGYVAKPKQKPACNRLAGFITFVTMRTGKKITKEQAESFIKQANEIQAALGC